MPTIRHYGFLSNRNRLAKVQLAKTLLHVKETKEPPENQPAHSPGLEELPACPFCGQKKLLLLGQIEPTRKIIVPDTS